MSQPTVAKITSENVISSSEIDEKAGKNGSDKMVGAAPSKKPFLGALPPSVSINLRSPSSWKLLARCWLAAWAAFLIMVPQASLRILGNTAFFSVLAAMFLPPSLPIQMFLMMISTLILGVLMGWGIGAAAMRAALAVRNQVLLEHTLQRVQSSAAGLANPDGLFTLAIFQGAFLDIRSSVIYGVFLAFGSFIFALCRAYAPKLTLFSIFGTIAIDIFCTLGPLFPFAQYTILNSLCTSLACYVAIAVVVTLFVFPETMNHSCMAATAAQLGQIKALIEMESTVLEADLEALAPGTPLMAKIAGARTAVLGGQKALMAKSGFINLEFSWGKWNGDDVRELEEPLLALVVRVSGIRNFARLVGEPISQAFDISKMRDNPDDSDALAATSTDTYLLEQICRRHDELEAQHSLHIQNMLPVIKDASADLREACVTGVASVQAVVEMINGCRWHANNDENAKCHEGFLTAITHLEAALTTFKEKNRHMLIEPYIPLLREAHTKEERRAVPLRSLYLAYVFATNLMMTADGLLSLMEKVRDTAAERKTNKLWAPKGLRTLKKLFTERDHEDGAEFGEDRSPEKPEAKVTNDSYRRDPDSRPPSNLPQKIMNTIHLLYKWSKTPEAFFTFKYTFISVALWLPAVILTSAHFYYVQKGLWALIMAQTTMTVYASDQIFNYFTRIIGTVVGLLLGLACWYIGAGSGHGNPYGMAASVAVFLIPIIWLRLFSPIQYQVGVILTCVTWALIMGYSWIDAHLEVIGSPGVGWPVSWRRFVLVIIGAAATFIIMMLPPTSGRKAVRLRNANVINSISETYSFLISTWIGNQKDTRSTSATWLQDFRAKLISLSDQVQSVKQMTELAKWEGSVRGKWPVEEYQRLVDVEYEMISGLAQLGGALARMEDTWRIEFLHSTHVLHPNFISDVMAMFSLVSHSLRTAEPIQQVLPRPLLERLFYHHRTAFLSPNSNKKDMIDFEEMQSLDYMFYCSGLVAVYHVLQSLDELYQITKTLVGEVPFIGFDQWKDEYNRAHTMA